MVDMSEKSTPLWIKVVTVVIAIGLASGYIVYRNNMTTPSSSNAGSPKDSAELANEDAEPPEADPAIFSSSKSEVLPLMEMTPELRRALMSSSKSGLILPLHKEEEDQAQQNPPRTIMPSSKSGRAILPGSKSFQLVDPPEPEEE